MPHFEPQKVLILIITKHMKHLLIVFSLFATSIWAQPIKVINNSNTYKYMFGLGWNVLDDDGIAGNPFEFNNMHGEFFPSRLMFDYYFYNGWSAEAAVGFTRYNANGMVNGQRNLSGFFLSSDVNLKYSFYKMLGSGVIDPYLISGLGGSLRNCDDSLVDDFTPTLNLGVGFNLWLGKSVGLQFQTTGKIGLVSDFFGKADYLQHSIGLVLRTDALGRGQEQAFQKKKFNISTKQKKIRVPRGKRQKKGKDT